MGYSIVTSQWYLTQNYKECRMWNRVELKKNMQFGKKNSVSSVKIVEKNMWVEKKLKLVKDEDIVSVDKMAAIIKWRKFSKLVSYV